MIQSFKDPGTQAIFDGENTQSARKTCPPALWEVTARKLDLLDSVISLHELKIPPGNRFEAMKGELKGQHSIRINDRYRICFFWTENGLDQVEILGYHA